MESVLHSIEVDALGGVEVRLELDGAQFVARSSDGFQIERTFEAELARKLALGLSVLVASFRERPSGAGVLITPLAIARAAAAIATGARHG